MSNLAQANIYKPQALSFEIQQFRQAMVCWISGSYKTYRVKFPLTFSLEILKKKIFLKQTISKNAFFFYQTHAQRHLQMLYQQRSLLHVYMNNWIVGNLVGFQKALRVRGVGYKFDISPLKITVQAGYSHLLLQKLPLPLYFQSIILNKKAVKISMQGSNLMRINLYLAAIRNLRQPDVYKGKGLRYKKEIIMRKEGKKKKN
jgi:large subunit ribosomal protein L6